MSEINDFLDYLKADRAYSPATIKTYGDTLTSVASYFQKIDEQLNWMNIDADVVRNWMMAEMNRGENARTISKNLSAMRSFYKYLRRVGRIDHNPMQKIQNPRMHKPLPTFLKQSEVDRLFDEVKFPEGYEGMLHRLILLTFYHTGVRLSELVGLNVENINLAQQELKVTGKRNKQRIIPFGNELTLSLKSFLIERTAQSQTTLGPLFLTTKNERIKKDRVQAIVKSYLSLVTTQKKKSPHVLRHTFATAMLNNGADLEAIKEILGHESVTTTEVYTHTTFADLKKEYQLAHPRA